MLPKVVRHCTYMNRLLQDGLNMDSTFSLKETVDDYVYRKEKEI